MNTNPSPEKQSRAASEADDVLETTGAGVSVDGLYRPKESSIYVDELEDCCFVRSLN